MPLGARLAATSLLKDAATLEWVGSCPGKKSSAQDPSSQGSCEAGANFRLPDSCLVNNTAFEAVAVGYGEPRRIGFTANQIRDAKSNSA